jgi:hypothetical protein
MVQLEHAGIIITIVLLTTSALLTTIASQPSMEGSSLPPSMVQISANQARIENLTAQFNSDLNLAASSTGLTQIGLGASTIVAGGQLFFSYIVAGFTNWLDISKMVFAWAEGTPLLLFADVFNLIMTIVMAYTILKFIGGIVKSLPFFGGG